jgi:hypothetical protein
METELSKVLGIYEDNIKMDIEEICCKDWTEFIFPRMWSVSELL